MKTRPFARVDGLGVASLHSFCASRTVMEPVVGLILTLGLFWTLAGG